MFVGGACALVPGDHREPVPPRHSVQGDRVQGAQRESLECNDRRISDLLWYLEGEVNTVSRVGAGAEGPRIATDDVLPVRQIPAERIRDEGLEGAGDLRRGEDDREIPRCRLRAEVIPVHAHGFSAL